MMYEKKCLPGLTAVEALASHLFGLWAISREVSSLMAAGVDLSVTIMDKVTV